MAVLAISSALAAPIVNFSDDFNRADSSTPGGNWQVLAVTNNSSLTPIDPPATIAWGISSNTLVSPDRNNSTNAATGIRYTTWNTSYTIGSPSLIGDQVVTMDINFNNDYQGIVMNYTVGAGGGYNIPSVSGYLFEVNGGTGNLSLSRFSRASASTSLTIDSNTSAGSLNDANFYRVQLTLSGAGVLNGGVYSIVGGVAGGATGSLLGSISGYDAGTPLTGGYAGVSAVYGGTGEGYDNFSIVTVPEPSPLALGAMAVGFGLLISRRLHQKSRQGV